MKLGTVWGHHPSLEAWPCVHVAPRGTGQLEPGGPQLISQYWICVEPDGGLFHLRAHPGIT